MLIQNAKAFIDGCFCDHTALRIQDGVIVEINPSDILPDEDVLDLCGDYLMPGFVDVHIHAYKGHDVMNGEADVRYMSRELKKAGVAAFLPTTMSASAEDTRKALAGIHAVMEHPEPNGAAVLGAHMEAPFLNPQKCGAQVKEHFVLPTQENWYAYVGEYESVVRMITMAPELPGSMDMIRWLHDKGITVSIGHTAADANTAHCAIKCGATHSTHTFNAQTPLNHREPGVPGAVLSDSRVYCEMIADCIHLHPDILSIIASVKGAERTVAITDAMEASGMPEGKYSLGGQDVFVKDGAARLANGTLAGSILTMNNAFLNLLKLHIASADAALMTSRTPALSIGCTGYGQIAVGTPSMLMRRGQEFELLDVIG